jgi:integrase
MLTIKLRYVQDDVDARGNVRVYFRRPGFPKIRMRELVGSEEFYRRYHELLRASEVGALKPDADTGPKPGTWRWLCCEHLKSNAFKRLDPATQQKRRLTLDKTYDEPVFPGSAETFADFPLSRITTMALRVLRDRKSDLPEAANNRVRAIRAVFKWAVKEEHVTANPARDLEKLPTSGEGFHSWTIEEVEQYERRHTVGTKARLALALLLYTGTRRSDVVQLGRQHVRDGWLKFRVHKNRNRRPITIEIPILPELQRIIDGSPTGDLTFLVTDFGKSFSIAGFSNKMRQWCDEAGLPHCTAHGLRKAGAAIAAENGATEHELMAIYGWATPMMAETYTRAARRKVMAGNAMGKLIVRNKKGA